MYATRFSPDSEDCALTPARMDCRRPIARPVHETTSGLFVSDGNVVARNQLLFRATIADAESETPCV
jgi:hypothetical protein